jgi:hypothetical protein
MSSCCRKIRYSSRNNTTTIMSERRRSPIIAGQQHMPGLEPTGSPVGRRRSIPAGAPRAQKGRRHLPHAPDGRGRRPRVLPRRRPPACRSAKRCRTDDPAAQRIARQELRSPRQGRANQGSRTREELRSAHVAAGERTSPSEVRNATPGVISLSVDRSGPDRLTLLVAGELSDSTRSALARPDPSDRSGDRPYRPATP